MNIHEICDLIDENYYKANNYYLSINEPEEFAKRVALEFGKQCFEASREFNSKDGTVDIDVVIFYKGADNSDLEPKFPLFEDYIISLENKTQD